MGERCTFHHQSEVEVFRPPRHLLLLSVKELCKQSRKVHYAAVMMGRLKKIGKNLRAIILHSKIFSNSFFSQIIKQEKIKYIPKQVRSIRAAIK